MYPRQRAEASDFPTVATFHPFEPAAVRSFPVFPTDRGPPCTCKRALQFQAPWHLIRQGNTKPNRPQAICPCRFHIQRSPSQRVASISDVRDHSASQPRSSDQIAQLFNDPTSRNRPHGISRRPQAASHPFPSTFATFNLPTAVFQQRKRSSSRLVSSLPNRLFLSSMKQHPNGHPRVPAEPSQ